MSLLGRIIIQSAHGHVGGLGLATALGHDEFLPEIDRIIGRFLERILDKNAITIKK